MLEEYGTFEKVVGYLQALDVFVVLDDEILGKPKDAEDARIMLKKQSGNDILVVSGVALIDSESGKEIVQNEVTKVKIKNISEKEIDAYVKTGHPLDKAGSFGVQGKG